MRADFEITIRDVDRPMQVRVVVHESLGAMRSAVTQQDNRLRKKRKKKANNDYLAICQRFHMWKSPLYCIVRFAPSHIGAGIVAHEMAHAAVWLWHVKNQFEDVPLLDDANDEWFAWILGELVSRTTDMFYKKGVYQ